MVGLFSKSVADLACPKFVRNADARTISTLKTIRWYVDCGDHDFLLEKNREFVAAMKQAGIPLKVQYRRQALLAILALGTLHHAPLHHRVLRGGVSRTPMYRATETCVMMFGN